MAQELPTDVAAAWWRADFDAHDVVDGLMSDHPETIPSVIRSLAETAPDGALSYIGVDILEGLSISAEHEARPDLSLDLLLSAGLERAVVFEILSGPYPEYLDRWDVRERLAGTFTPVQINALYDWSGRLNRRLVLDGDGFRHTELSGWFKS